MKGPGELTTALDTCRTGVNLDFSKRQEGKMTFLISIIITPPEHIALNGTDFQMTYRRIFEVVVSNVNLIMKIIKHQRKVQEFFQC